jgi:hypothetical protein
VANRHTGHKLGGMLINGSIRQNVVSILNYQLNAF